MKQQVLSSSDFYKHSQKKLKNAWISIWVTILVTVMCIPILILTPPPVLSFPLLSVLVCEIKYIYVYCSKKRMLADIDKNRFFLENSQMLNRNIGLIEQILPKVSNKTRKIIKTTKNQDVFTINSIDSICYKDFQQICDYVERFEAFGFVMDEPKEYEEQGPVLQKNR